MTFKQTNKLSFRVGLLALCIFLTVPICAAYADQHRSTEDRLSALQMRFERLDRNGDGILTTNEVPRAKLFQRYDINQDGRISLQEFRRAEEKRSSRKKRREQDSNSHSTDRVPRSASIKTYFDRVYDTHPGVDANLLSLDIYAPATGKNHPVVAMVHGGGWSTGDKRTEHTVGNKAGFFVSSGFVFVSVNYRLAPAARYPAPVRDVARAVSWIYSNIGQYGGNPDILYLIGHSAGAQLVALVATDESYLKANGKDLSILDGVILLDGSAYDVEKALRNAKKPEIYKQAFGTKKDTLRAASPIYHVAKGKDIPPFLILVTPRKNARLQSAAFAEALRKAGVTTSVKNVSTDHEGINRELGLADSAVTGLVANFLNIGSLRKEGRVSPGGLKNSNVATSAAVRRFKRLDRNGDGVISQDEINNRRLFRRFDANGDGTIDRHEVLQFDRASSAEKVSRTDRKATEVGDQATGGPMCGLISPRAEVLSFSWGHGPARDGAGGSTYQRYACVVKPPSYRAGEHIPLIVAMHGHNQNPVRHARDTRFHDMCDGRWGFSCIVVYPASCLDIRDMQKENLKMSDQCVGGANARWERKAHEWDDRDDAGFIHELIRRIPGADQTRVHVSGASNGGKFMYRLLCNSDGGPIYESYSGIMTVHPGDSLKSSGQLDLCKLPPLSKPPELAHIHGTKDRVFPLTDFDSPGSVAINYGYSANPKLISSTKEKGQLRVDHYQFGPKVKLFLLEGGEHNPKEDFAASTATVLFRDFLAPLWGGKRSGSWDLQAYNTRCRRNRCPSKMTDDGNKPQWAGIEFRLREPIEVTQISVNSPLVDGENISLWRVDDQKLLGNWTLPTHEHSVEYWEHADVSLRLRADTTYRLVAHYLGEKSGVQMAPIANASWKPWAPAIDQTSVKGIREFSQRLRFPNDEIDDSEMYGLINFRYNSQS